MNKYTPHVHVFVEDDAYRDIVNGFLTDPSLNARAIQPLPLAGGWSKLCDKFAQEHIQTMNRYPSRHMVLVLDFDKKDNRMERVQRSIPENLKQRVYVIGVWSEPEDLRRSFNMSREAIGRALAQDCREGTSEIWDHELFKHNADERQRMMSALKPILFP